LNRSYSPSGKSRDENIENICHSHAVAFHSYQDFLLIEPEELEQRKVFTPFSILWKKFLFAHPGRIEIHKFDGMKVKWFIP
jgi:deoxyribodipyrimidine photolyase